MTEKLPEERLRSLIHIRDKLLRNALSELFGTFMLLFLGLTIVMQFILSGEKLNTWIQINIGWGLAITFTVYSCSKTSGGHLNPAVSLTMLTLGKLSAKDFLVYCVVQTIGAFLGAAAAYGIYYDQFVHFAGDLRVIAGEKATAACFCSFPAPHVSNLTSFFDQVVGTGLLVFFVCVITDKRNGIPAAAHPFLFGFVLILIGHQIGTSEGGWLFLPTAPALWLDFLGTCMGMNLGYPINPARDFGPRIFASFIYGTEVFTYHNYYFWIPIIAPLFGGVLAAWSYQVFIGAHIPDPQPNEDHEHEPDDAKLLLKSPNDVEGNDTHKDT